MGKYLLIFKNSISESLIYRTSVFLMFVSQLISTSVLILLWSAIYSEGGFIGDYSLTSLIQYYILVGMINFIIQGVDVSWRVAEEIKMGKVTNYILKPLNYYLNVLAVVTGKSLMNLIITAAVIFPVIYFGGYFEGIGLSFPKVFYFILSMIIAFGLFVTYSYIVALYTFWAGDVRGMNYVMKLIAAFFSGAIIPLNLLPQSFNSANDWMPFKSMAWVPVTILTDKITPGFMTLLPGVIWAVILLLLAEIIYKEALKKYEGLGA